MGATLYDRPSGPATQADIAGAGDLRYQQLNAPDPGILWGCIMSTAGASTTLTVSAGYAVDSTNVLRMRLASAMAKTTSAWAAGTAAGGLDTGAIANSTWYHWFVIYNPTTLATDVVFSATATPANGPTLMPSGFTLFRRIGAMKTNGSAQWTFFVQTGDNFRWGQALLDANASNPGTAAVTRTLTVPTGIVVEIDIAALIAPITSGTVYCLITSLTETDRVASGSDTNSAAAVAAQQNVTVIRGVFTNTSAQIRTRFSVSGLSDTIDIYTFGWIDTRGRLG